MQGFNPCSVGFGPSTRLAPAESSIRTMSFNPCSVGFGPSTPLCRLDPPGESGFQSLFCWIRPLNDFVSLMKASEDRFQSLFCWIRPLNTGLPTLPLLSTGGFNPCSVGFGPSTAATR